VTLILKLKEEFLTNLQIKTKKKKGIDFHHFLCFGHHNLQPFQAG
jgi:hypothetical protein